jgi:hypothetical protein
MSESAEDMYEEICEEIVAACPRKFRRATVKAMLVHGWNEYEAAWEGAVAKKGGSIDVSTKLDELFVRLRSAMARAQPGKGAWFTAHVTVDSNGTFKFDFNYDRKPDFADELDEKRYRDDLRDFPRSPECIPEWLRVMVR